jgi:signal transduction histidine kinase
LSELIAGPMTVTLPPGVRVALLSGLAVHTMSLLCRRRYPAGAFVVTLTAGLVLLVAGLPTVVLGLAPLIAVYSVALGCPRRWSLTALACAVLALTIGQVAQGYPQDMSTMGADVAALVAAWAAGRFVGARLAALRALDAKNRELEAARNELAWAAITEERLRMARELHDIIAHSLSVIAVQSGVGAHVVDADPDASRRALVTIGEVSRQALVEIRHVVKVLRDSTDAELAPVPGLAQLTGLTDQLTPIGLRIDVVEAGEPGPLPAAVDSTAYRIVQEALTNVLRHAQATWVRVRVTRAPGELLLEVVDDGRSLGSASAGEGHGLRGMRERAQLLGGSLDAGPVHSGGFRVAARLPLSGAAR